MADVLGLSDVSSKDTGKGKQLKTGNLKRSYSMSQKKKKSKKCPQHKIYDTKLKRCVPLHTERILRDKPPKMKIRKVYKWTDSEQDRRRERRRKKK